MTKAERLQRRLEGRIQTRAAANDPAALELANLLSAAQRAQPSNIHVGADDAQTVHVDPRHSGRAAARGEIDVRQLAVSPLEKVRESDRAGQHNILTTAILEQSRVYRAGARVISMPHPRTVDNNGVPTWQQEPAELISLAPGEMMEIDADDEHLPDEVTASDWPATSVAIDPEEFRQFAIRYHIKRADFRDKGVERVAIELMEGIAGAVARAADSVLLDAVSSEELDAFSLASAAAAGAQLEELRAVIGTHANGAQVNENGELLAAPGVSAELSPNTTKTFVADWNKSGVVVDDNITMLAERLGADGAVALTCWVDLQAVIADAGYFWEVSA